MRYTRRSAVAAVMVAGLLLGATARARAQAQPGQPAAAAGTAQGQVLQYVPGDALVVVRVRNLQQVSQKVAKWAEAVGIAAMSREMADPLGSLKNELKITQGLNEQGDMAFAFVDPKLVGGDEDKALLVLLPVSDYQAFLKNFPGAKTQGEVSTFQPEGAPQEYFAAKWGNYAAVAAAKELLAKKPTGIKLPAITAKEVAARDAVLWANIPALRAHALPALKEGRAEALKGIEEGLANDPNAPKQFAPVIKAAVNQFMNVAEGYLNDSQSALVSLNLSDDGIRLAALSEFSPGSYSGKLALGIKPGSQALVSGLPDRKYFVVGGASSNSDVFSRAMADFLNPIAKELGQVEGGKQFADAVNAIQQSLAATKSISFGYVMPEGNLGQEALVQGVAVAKGDAQKIAQTQKQFLKGYSALFAGMPKEAGEVAFNIKEGARTVGGVKLDEFTLDMKVADPAQQEQMKMVMGLIYGPGGAGGVMGAVDNSTFITVQGANDKLLNDAVAAAKANKPNPQLIPNTAMVDKNLPENKFFVEYIALDNIARTAVKAGEQFGFPIKFNLPPNLPPVGFAAAAEGSAVRMDLFVPTQTVQSIVAAGMQAFMQMQGGQQPGQEGL